VPPQTLWTSDAVPEEIDAAGVGTYLVALPGVVDVHDLHV
jgi:hypothetical protein